MHHMCCRTQVSFTSLIRIRAKERRWELIMKKFSPWQFLPFGKKTFKKEKKFYQVSIKLRILMAVEFFLLTSAYLLILFFYLQNCHLQQNTSIYNLNHTLLLHANSVLEKLDTASGFPLAHMADRYNDPLLKYLVEKNHGGITQTDFYRFFYNRTNEVFIQFPEEIGRAHV